MTNDELILARGPRRLLSILAYPVGQLRQLDITVDLSKDDTGDVPAEIYGEILRHLLLDWIPLTDIDEQTLKVTYRIFGVCEVLEDFADSFEYPCEFGHTAAFDPSPVHRMYEIELMVSSDFEVRFVTTMRFRGLQCELKERAKDVGHPIYLVRGPWILLMSYYFNEYMEVSSEEDEDEAVFLWTSMVPCPWPSVEPWTGGNR